MMSVVSTRPEWPAFLDLAQLVGASGHATFRRYVRGHDGIAVGVVLDLSPCSRFRARDRYQFKYSANISASSSVSFSTGRSARFMLIRRST
jgi:hypothetical protein